jgi:hypothetical protein
LGQCCLAADRQHFSLACLPAVSLLICLLVCLLSVLLCCLQDVDWSAAFPNTPLSASLRAFEKLLDALAAARSAHEAAAAAHALPEEVPDEFTDPITMDLMREPVRLPDSQIVVDRCGADDVAVCFWLNAGVSWGSNSVCVCAAVSLCFACRWWQQQCIRFCGGLLDFMLNM